MFITTGCYTIVSMSISVNKKIIIAIISTLAVCILGIVISHQNTRLYALTQSSGSIGVEGKIPSPPPSVGATISLPRDGQAYSSLPVTVSGLCPAGLLLKLFKNNVFAGSQQCNNGSFSLQVDLFTGTNVLVARVYDALDQPGPDSNNVTVSFNDNKQGASSRVTITSNYAKRGANPGESLTWPIILSGGSGPYAVSIDWGDGKVPDLKSLESPGPFDIQHAFDTPGVYNVVVKVTDKNGISAFLQIVAIANGALSQDNSVSGGSNTSGTAGDTKTKTKVIWQPAALSVPLVVATFWLGKKYALARIKRKIETGDRPF